MRTNRTAPAVVAVLLGLTALPTAGQERAAPNKMAGEAPAVPRVLSRVPAAGPAAVASAQAGTYRVDPAQSLCVAITPVMASSGSVGVWSSLPAISAARTVDLTLRARLEPAQQLASSLTVELYAPDGSLYRRFESPLALQAQAGGALALSGYPQPVAAAQATRVKGGGNGVSVDTVLPIAGTDIVSSGLYGLWTVNAFVGAAHQSCPYPTVFRLKP